MRIDGKHGDLLSPVDYWDPECECWLLARVNATLHFYNFIQSGTFLYYCDYEAGLSGKPDESLATVTTWPYDSSGSRVFTSLYELTGLNCKILYWKLWFSKHWCVTIFVWCNPDGEMQRPARWHERAGAPASASHYNLDNWKLLSWTILSHYIASSDEVVYYCSFLMFLLHVGLSGSVDNTSEQSLTEGGSKYSSLGLLPYTWLICHLSCSQYVSLIERYVTVLWTYAQ